MLKLHLAPSGRVGKEHTIKTYIVNLNALYQQVQRSTELKTCNKSAFA